jgi:hypothetical protein
LRGTAAEVKARVRLLAQVEDATDPERSAMKFRELLQRHIDATESVNAHPEGAGAGALDLQGW